MERAARRTLEHRRWQAGDALEFALLFERRQAADEQARIRMQRLVEDLAHRRDLHQPPGVHHPQAMDELGHQPHVVADQDHRRAELLLDASQGFHHLALDDHVERAGRLVGQNHLGPQRDGDGDAHALLHAAAQLVWEAVGNFRLEPDLVEQRRDARRGRLFGQLLVVVAHAVDDLFADAHHRVERVHRSLGDQRDRGQAQAAHRLVGNLEQIDPVELHAPAFDPTRRSDEAHERQGDGRLTRARLAHQPEAFVRQQAETDAIDRLHRSARRVVPHPQIVNAQDVSRHQVRLRRRGLANSSSPTAIRNSPVNSVMMMMIGGNHHHHHELMIAA